MSQVQKTEGAGLRDAVASGDYRLDQEGAPKPYKEDVVESVRFKIAELLPTLSFGHLSTLASDGWPVGSYARFVATFDEDQHPTVYLALSAGGRDVANIRREPRVSFETHFTASFERRREARGVQFQGVASLVDAEEETDAVATFSRTFGDAPFAADQLLVRIAVLSVVMFDASGRPQWGQLDYYGRQEQ